MLCERVLISETQLLKKLVASSSSSVPGLLNPTGLQHCQIVNEKYERKTKMASVEKNENSTFQAQVGINNCWLT